MTRNRWTCDDDREKNMSQRQRKRRAQARKIADAIGRDWLTGETARLARARERTRETIRQTTNVVRRKRGLSPIEDGRSHIELPHESSSRKTRDLCLLADRQETERREAIERGWSADRHRLAVSRVHQSVRIVDTPAPMLGAFRMRDI